MSRDRVLTTPLAACLALVLVLLGTAGYARWRPRPFPELVEMLRTADLEGGERLAVLRRIRELPADSSGPALPLSQTMAAVALGDPSVVDGLGGRPLLQRGDVEHVDTAALGDEVLYGLLRAMAAELGGDREQALEGYRRVGASSRLFHMPVVRRLCDEGLARLR